LREWDNETPPAEVHEFLDDCDFDSREIFLSWLAAQTVPGTESDKALAFYRHVTELLEGVQESLEDELAAQNECHHCHGSGGGYMGSPEPRCPYCRGTGRRAA
ncbi:MAG: hypothetical protein D6746_15850, partial [Bacteroidetes bacterium]